VRRREAVAEREHLAAAGLPDDVADCEHVALFCFGFGMV
jgi:hypothetical protein